MPREGARRGPGSSFLPPSPRVHFPRVARPVPAERAAPGALPRYRFKDMAATGSPARATADAVRSPGAARAAAAHGGWCGGIFGRNLAHPCAQRIPLGEALVAPAATPAPRKYPGRAIGPEPACGWGWERVEGGAKKKRLRRGKYHRDGLACACGPAGRRRAPGGGGVGGCFTPRPRRRRRRLEAAGRRLQGMKTGQNYFRGRRDAPAWQARQ